MLRYSLAVSLLLSLPSLGFAQNGATALPIEGVWRIADRINPDPHMNGPATGPSLAVFTKKHYSILAMHNGQPKVAPFKTPGKPTDAEKIARYEYWDFVVATAGTYEVKGTTLIRHPSVAKDEPGTGATSSDELKFEGNNTMWHISKQRSVKYVRLE